MIEKYVELVKKMGKEMKECREEKEKINMCVREKERRKEEEEKLERKLATRRRIRN